MNLFIKSLMVAAMFTCFMVFLTTGCSKSIPEIEAGLKIPAPSFDQSQITLSSFVVPNANGLCHKLIKRIEIRVADQGWVDLASIDAGSTVTCATDGKFKFKADFTTGYLSAAKAALESGAMVKVEVRGFSEIMVSEVGQVLLSYGAAQSPFNTKIARVINRRTGGAGSYLVSGEAKNINPAAASAHYFVYGAIRNK